MELCATLRAGGATRNPARAEAWLLIRDALSRYIRCYSGRAHPVPREDLEDLASAKALEVLLRAESGEWNPEGRHPGEVAGYLAAVARNGLTRLAEHRRRETAPGAALANGEVMEFEDRDRVSPGADSAAEAAEFVATLRCCVSALAPRARRVWFFRAFYEMSSREIAAHPEVGLTPPHVDVVVQRARESLRACLESRGIRSRDYPAGAFAELWSCLASLDTAAAPKDAHAR